MTGSRIWFALTARPSCSSIHGGFLSGLPITSRNVLVRRRFLPITAVYRHVFGTLPKPG